VKPRQQPVGEVRRIGSERYGSHRAARRHHCLPIFSSHTRSIRTAVFSRLGGSLAAHNDTVIVRALVNISLNLADGDRLGLVGSNGAGKTTFLRVVSGVYPPLAGEAVVEGKVSSFTDIGLGMDPEATGWQNIVFRCVFLGLTFAQAKALAPSIGEFSELGAYLDLLVRTYSTGMFVRLAFAISTSVQPDIVVMDEMIAAGDQSFMQKAQKRIADLLERAYSRAGFPQHADHPQLLQQGALARPRAG
jgi:ABC-type polysaccharide/polyol phosphate transport system ATPase subunit